jgi:ferredoxin
MADLKIAIIGSGASAVGVLSGLQSLDIQTEITIFSGEKYFGFSLKDLNTETEIKQFYDDLYADIKRTAVNYPPRKTFFGDAVPCYTVNGEDRFFVSDMFGGQTNIWGGFILPLREKDFESWPISRRELEPHYQAIADLIGIAGEHDRVSDFLQLEYSNRRPVKQLEGFRFLGDHVNRHSNARDYIFYAGASRNAVDTLSDSSTSCVHCGECMAGCLRDSIYSSKNTLKKYIERKEIRFVRRNIKEIRVKDNRPEVHPLNGSSELFDKVFLCAGCVSTTEILMRSLHLTTRPVMQDNVIYQLPIINVSGHADRKKDEYFGLTNLFFLLEPKSVHAPFLQVQFYPNVDYLLRTLIPQWSWNLVRYPWKWLRDRVLWARVYMDTSDSFRYLLSLQDDQLVFQEENVPDKTNLTLFKENLRQVLRGSGYFMLPFEPVLAHTSAHLACTFPYGSGTVRVERDGEVMTNVHIADSTCFPESPVISPTLTIMANARRTAVEAVEK